MHKHSHRGFVNRIRTMHRYLACAWFDYLATRIFNKLMKGIDHKHPDREALWKVLVREARSLPGFARNEYVRAERRKNPLFDPDGLKTDESHLREVFDFSYDKHRHTRPRARGEAYFFHIVRGAIVVVRVQAKFGLHDLATVIDIILHDALEEAEESGHVYHDVLSEMKTVVGDERTFEVLCLSKRPGELAESYFNRLLKAAWRVLIAKIVDRIDNIWTIEAMPDAKRKKKIRETEEWFGKIYVTLTHLLEREVDAGRESRGWLELARFLNGYLWYAVKDKKKVLGL